MKRTKFYFCRIGNKQIEKKPFDQSHAYCSRHQLCIHTDLDEQGIRTDAALALVNYWNAGHTAYKYWI